MEDQVSMQGEVLLRRVIRDRPISLLDDLPTAVQAALLPVFERHAADITLAVSHDAAAGQGGRPIL